MRSSIAKKENIFTQLYRRIENIPGKRPEVFILLLYIVLLGVIASFHEPWFDEAQAWQIAKYASIKDILFTVPHYEGHPPLWHLILLLPAKLGAPYELSIKAINIAISAIASWILIFRSPFPRVVRLSLPFTYFLFYQYGVISRPYSLMFLALVLAAAAYPRKDVKPFLFVLALMLLVLSSAYGIVLAAGIALTWLVEMRGRQKITDYIKSLLRDKRAWALLLLLFLALVNIWLILPRDDTYAIVSEDVQNNALVRLGYMFFILPADALFFNCFNNSFGKSAFLITTQLSPVNYIAGIILGILLWCVLLLFARKSKTTLLLVLPYSLYALFGSFVYFARHHIGTAALFLLFWLWVSAGKHTAARNMLPAWLEKPLSSDPTWHSKLARLLSAVCAFVIVISVFWTAAASFNEIGTPYGFGRQTASFIKEYGLDDLKIMAVWKEATDPETGETVMIDTNYTFAGVTILPYFDANIILNATMAYNTHQAADEDTNRKNYAEWADYGIPDVLVGYVDLYAVYGDAVTMDDYARVYEAHQSLLWKADNPENWFYIYVRRDLLSQYGLTEIDVDFGL